MLPCFALYSEAVYIYLGNSSWVNSVWKLCKQPCKPEHDIAVFYFRISWRRGEVVVRVGRRVMLFSNLTLAFSETVNKVNIILKLKLKTIYFHVQTCLHKTQLTHFSESVQFGQVHAILLTTFLTLWELPSWISPSPGRDINWGDPVTTCWGVSRLDDCVVLVTACWLVHDLVGKVIPLLLFCVTTCKEEERKRVKACEPTAQSACEGKCI